jgi:hypothetical protein
MNIPTSAPFTLRTDPKLATQVLRWVMSPRGGVTHGMRAINAYRQATRRFYYLEAQDRVCEPFQRLVFALFKRHAKGRHVTEDGRQVMAVGDRVQEPIGRTRARMGGRVPSRVRCRGPTVVGPG